MINPYNPYQNKYNVHAVATMPKTSNIQIEKPEIPQNNLSFAMAYVPKQPYIGKTYDTMTGLKKGTLFPEMDKPWIGKKGVYYG